MTVPWHCHGNMLTQVASLGFQLLHTDNIEFIFTDYYSLLSYNNVMPVILQLQFLHSCVCWCPEKTLR